MTIRFDQETYNKIESTARAADLSVSEYIRRMVVKGKVNVRQEIVAEVPMLKKLIAEFGKIGPNLIRLPATTTAVAFAPERCTSAPSAPYQNCTP